LVRWSSFHLAGGLLALLFECCSRLSWGRSASTYDHGVQSRAGETRSTDKVLSGGEFVLIVLLELERVIGVLGTIVEALGDSGDRRDCCREGKESGRTHFGGLLCAMNVVCKLKGLKSRINDSDGVEETGIGNSMEEQSRKVFALTCFDRRVKKKRRGMEGERRREVIYGGQGRVGPANGKRRGRRSTTPSTPEPGKAGAGLLKVAWRLSIFAGQHSRWMGQMRCEWWMTSEC